MSVEMLKESLETPVAGEFDVCVIGGSCTGVFAAIRAAQAGARVALIEMNGILGGTATAGMVNIWHSLYDTEGRKQIIAGLTLEMIERLKLRDAVKVRAPTDTSAYAIFNPAEMTIELDMMLAEAKLIRPFLHARFVKPIMDGDGKVVAAVIEDKSGRRAIKARAFVDASGDGDLIHRAGLPTWKGERLQPPTTGAVINGYDEIAKLNPGFTIEKALEPCYGGGFKHLMAWSADYPGFPGMRFLAATRVNGADCSDADSLTDAEIEGRRQVRAIFDVVRGKMQGGDKLRLAALSSATGIRETRHCEALHRLEEMEVLDGVRFPDAIANGSYRVDVHGGAGIVFKYLNGRSSVQRLAADGLHSEWVEGRWREETASSPTFYQIPYRSLVPKGARNALSAGRIVDASESAYGAVRVMVNCNQTGEAAGLAAAMAADSGCEIDRIDVQELRAKLAQAGAIII